MNDIIISLDKLEEEYKELRDSLTEDEEKLYEFLSNEDEDDEN